MFNDSKDSNIILQGVLLTGIKNITFDSSVNERAVKLLNNQGIKRKISSPQKTTCSFSKPYNGKDFIQSLTGVPDLSGQFIYKDNAIDFSDAVISNYSLNLDENGFAQIDVTLQIFGDTKPTTNLKLSTASADFPIFDQTPTVTHFDLGGTNSAIKRLNYQASFNPKSSTNIGSINSSNVDFVSPTNHKISADIEMLEQEVEDVTGFVDNSKLTKNINLIFSPEEDVENVDRILQIQDTVKALKEEGVNVDDLDFTVGPCAYNAFQFDKASISSQNLNSKAGEVIQLRNEYNAYTNIEKITGSIPVPGSSLPSCSDHLEKLEDNLVIAISRSPAFFVSDINDFESRVQGETDLNLAEIKLSKGVQSTGEDFELELAGQQYFTNIQLLFNPDRSQQIIDFELSGEGEISDRLFSAEDAGITPIQIFDYELSGEGVVELSQNLRIPLPDEENFEGFEKGFQDASLFPEVIDFRKTFNIFDFELSGVGEVSEKIALMPTPLFQKEDFEFGFGANQTITSANSTIKDFTSFITIDVEDFQGEEFQNGAIIALKDFTSAFTIDVEDFEGDEFEEGVNSTNLYNL